jgi:integrase/recombinase XerD
MSSLAEALKEYLTLRHALGFRLRHAACTLPRFVRFLEGKRKPYITTALALGWAQEKASASPVTRADRLTMVRRFAAWRSATDPRTEIPPLGLLPRRYRRPTPYIYSRDEVNRILTSAASLPSPRGLRGPTCSTLFGLLAATGMRVGETTLLDRDDVDLKGGVIAIRHGKLGKSRFVPIHMTTREALKRYARNRDEVFPRSRTPAFFLSERGRRLSTWCAEDNFAEVSRQIGLRPKTGGPFGHGPRLHDLRHRFAVTTLIHWYRLGADVEREMPKLATYLGHARVVEVYWYLQAVPELLELATKRSERVAKDGGR